MILKTATPEEKNRQLRSVLDGFTGSLGLAAKYSKQLKDRKVPDGKVLGVHRYTIKGCETYVVVVKRTYGKTRGGGEPVFLYYAKMMNPSTGRISYLRPSFDITGSRNVGYLEFTEHFIKRLKERDGKEFTDLLKTAGGDTINPVMGTSGDLEATFGGYRVFIKREGSNAIITTMVTDDMLYKNQRPTGEKISEGYKKYEELKRVMFGAA